MADMREAFEQRAGEFIMASKSAPNDVWSRANPLLGWGEIVSLMAGFAEAESQVAYAAGARDENEACARMADCCPDATVVTSVGANPEMGNVEVSLADAMRARYIGALPEGTGGAK
jgi:hypothetical protein